MHVVVGLGNPGRKYVGTRHNVGFAVIEELAKRWHLSLGPTRHGLRAAQRSGTDERTMLVEPQLYMNRSGDALTCLEPTPTAARLVVVHDDLDLDAGAVRVKCGGGTAGHRGVDSIVACLGPAFTRIRVGIGRPPRGGDPVDYVLTPFDSEEQERVDAAVQRAADAVECVLRDGAAAAMNRFNARRRGHAPTTTPKIEEDVDA